MELSGSKVEGFCCQAPSEPRLALLRHQGFRSEIHRVAYAARRTSSAKLSFAVSLTARNGGQGREKANTFRRLSMLIGPSGFPAITRKKELVEPPGIAPGSSPLITCAFISIVRASPNPPNIGPMA